MGLGSYAREEFRRAPITVVATILGVVIALASLLVAVGLPAPSPAVAEAVGNDASTLRSLNTANLLICAAAFLASAFSSASAIRMLARRKWLAALVLSIPTAALSVFFTLTVLVLVPPKTLSPEAMRSAKDLVFYATAFIYVAIHGEAVLKDLGTPVKTAWSDDLQPPSGATILGMAGLILLVWSGLVGSGATKLYDTFLQ